MFLTRVCRDCSIWLLFSIFSLHCSLSVDSLLYHDSWATLLCLCLMEYCPTAPRSPWSQYSSLFLNLLIYRVVQVSQMTLLYSDGALDALYPTVTKSNFGKELVYLGCELWSIIEGSRGRNWSSDCGGPLLCWLALELIVCYLTHIAWDHVPNGCIAHSELDPPALTTNQENTHRQAYRLVL